MSDQQQQRKAPPASASAAHASSAPGAATTSSSSGGATGGGATGGKGLVLDDAEQTIPAYSPVCTYCAHWDTDADGRHCAAFPAGGPGIPMSIWLGRAQHFTPVAGQKNDVVFAHDPQFPASMGPQPPKR